MHRGPTAVPLSLVKHTGAQHADAFMRWWHLQEAKVERIIAFLEEPKKITDKDLAAAVGTARSACAQQCMPLLVAVAPVWAHWVVECTAQCAWAWTSVA